jgi:hypothetical protein
MTGCQIRPLKSGEMLKSGDLLNFEEDVDENTVILG